jgi:hypothetical protein
LSGFNPEKPDPRGIYVGIAPSIERRGQLNVSAMDWMIRVITVVAKSDRRHSDPDFTVGRMPMATARNARTRRKSAQFRHVCDGIGRELRAYYLPISSEPIPGELKELLAHLVALEWQAGRDRPAELQNAGNQAELPPRV